MKRPVFTCDRCGRQQHSDPFCFFLVQRDDAREELHIKKLSAMDRSVGMMKLCKYCKNEIVEFIRGGRIMRELWKVVENHPKYEVSTLGNVRNVKTGKELKPYDDGDGYLRVKLDRENCRLHILVAVAFVPNPEGKPVVNHKHGKKHDCRASQLEWVTVAENTQHAYDSGLIRRRRTVKRKAVLHGR